MSYVDMNVLRSLISKIRSGELNSFDISGYVYKAFKAWLTWAKTTYADGTVRYDFSKPMHLSEEVDNAFLVDRMSSRLGYHFNINHGYQVAFVMDSTSFRFFFRSDVVDYEVRDDDELPEDMHRYPVWRDRNPIYYNGDFMTEWSTPIPHLRYRRD